MLRNFYVGRHSYLNALRADAYGWTVSGEEETGEHGQSVTLKHLPLNNRKEA